MKTAILGCALALGVLGCAHGARTVHSASPASGEQLLLVAQQAAREGDTLRAQQYLLAALASGVDDPRILPWLLRSYVADGQYRSAIQQVRERLSVHEDDVLLRLLLANLYRATELDASALEQYEQVLERAPGAARAHLELATMLYDSGADSARAEQHFRTYLQLEPDGPDAAAVRARLLKAMP